MAKDQKGGNNSLPQTASSSTEGKAADRVGIIPVNKIRQNVVALRPVEKESVDYMNLADSVKKRGVLIPILVREFENPDQKGEILYGLIDGLQRYNAALDAGLTEIKAAITDMNQAEIEETQIITNAQKIETKPVQYANQIDRLLQRNPTLTVGELAGRLSKTPGWIYKMLGMVKRLHTDIKPLVDDKKIVVANAVELAKLPTDEQPQWSDKACTMEVGEFAANVASRLKQIREERKKGRAEGPPTFSPVAHQRKWSEIKTEYENGCPNVLSMLKRLKIETPEEAAKMIVSWVASMDPDSQAQQRQEHEAHETKRKEDQEKRKLERTKQREEEARKTRAELEAKIAQNTGQPAPATA